MSGEIQVHPKLIIITRQDLQPGYQLVQSTHAIADFIFQFPEIAKDWKFTSNSIITLSVPNEDDLKKIADKLESREIAVSRFNEPDIDNQLTAICVYGDKQSKRICSYLPLALRNYNTQTLINKHSKLEI